ncbi:kinase-like domain-containing protein [Mycena sanguinolenta]|nr:kinase-like domain-containing protein [Mycena sanguinolenta]
MVQLEGSSSWSESPGSSSISLPPGPAGLALRQSDNSSLPPPDPTSCFRTTILEWVEKWMESLQLPLGFIIYVFSLPLQLSHGTIIEIQLMVQEWVQWDILESLANYRSIVKTLFDIVKSTLMRDSLRISHIIAKEILECLSQDVYVLHDKLVAIFRHSESYKRFLACRGNRAQELMDLLQDVLDSLAESSARTRLFKALLRLSRASGLHPTCFPLTDLQIMGHQVAAGAFGDIWKGIVREQIVSVKVMRIFRDAEVRVAVEAFGREALIWRQLSHPNLLPFFGLYYLETRLCLVSPWLSNGHVLQFLENASPDIDRVSLMFDVAMGLEYLHAKHVVHGDLKGMNILVTPSHRACVADFGLSFIVNRSTLRFTHSTASYSGGTARYLAPELLLGEKQSHYGSDIYAFACVCYEILTGKAPFFELVWDATVILKVLAGTRPSRPETIPFDDSLWLLLLDCWNAQACDRPDASQIIQHLAGPTIGAKPSDIATVDWDETISSRCRRSLRDWPLLPSVATIERRIFGDGARSDLDFIVEACRERLEHLTLSDTQDHLPLILSPSNDDLSPRWHPSGILSPVPAYREEDLPLSSLRSTFIPISCLAHHVTENGDGRSPQMCRVFISTRDLPMVSSPILPSPFAAQPSRPPTPNNFSFLLENYQRMLAEQPSDVSSSSARLSPQPFTSGPLESRPVMHSDGNHSLLSTPDLTPSFTSPQETPSDHFAPTPDGSPFEGFSQQLFPPMSDDNLGPALHYNSGLSLCGGEQLQYEERT